MVGFLVGGFGWWFVVVCVCFRVWVCGLFCLGLGCGFGLCVLVWVFIVLWYCDLFGWLVLSLRWVGGVVCGVGGVVVGW